MSWGYRDLVLCGGLLDQPAQFLDRLRIVVYLEPEDCVVMQPDTAILLYDEESG